MTIRTLRLGLSFLFSFAFVLPIASAQDAKPKPDERQTEYYQPDEVQSVYLGVAEEDLKRMHAALPERIYVPASFRWRDISIDRVAIRFKGNSSSSPNQRHKRSFLVKFDKYDDNLRFLGLRRVSFDNGIQFGSLFSEPIITEILREQGIKTHRCNYAKLFLNDKFHGVYVNVERIDQTYIDEQLVGNGALYKVDLGGPGGNLQYQGNDPESYKRAFEPKSKAAEEDTNRLVEFIRMIHQSEPSEFADDLEAQLELDDFFRVTSVMLLSGAFDQLTGWNAHNYYLYHDPEQDRWRYIPWDLDVGFCEVAFGHIHVLADWNAAWPVPGHSQNPLLERIIANPTLLQRYRRHASEVLDKYFEPDQLCAKIDAKYKLIEQDLLRDPFPHQRATNPEDRDFAGIVASQKDFVRKRYATARQQLDDPGKRPKFAPRRRPGQQEPKPGPKSADAPSMLRLTSVDSSSVQLKWDDNADGEAGHILQRAVGADSKEFRNHLGQPGDKITTATDPAVQEGQTYHYRVYALKRTPQGMQGTGVSNVVTVRVEKK